MFRFQLSICFSNNICRGYESFRVLPNQSFFRWEILTYLYRLRICGHCKRNLYSVKSFHEPKINVMDEIKTKNEYLCLFLNLWEHIKDNHIFVPLKPPLYCLSSPPPYLFHHKLFKINKKHGKNIVLMIFSIYVSVTWTTSGWQLGDE